MQLKRIVFFILASAFALLWLIPLIWLIVTTFTEPSYYMSIIPRTPFSLQNIVYILSAAPFGRYYANTIMIVAGIFCVQCITVTLAAFALSVMNFRFEKLVFFLIFVQIIIPNDVLIMPNYSTISSLGLIDTKLAIMIPFYCSAFGILLLRQSFKTIPIALSDASKIDGCNLMQTIWKVYVPCAKPAYVSFGLVSISYHWNNYLWPVIVTNSVNNRPLTVGLAIFAKSKEAVMQWSNVCAATFIIIFPLLTAFLFFQKQFINSFVSSGIK